MESKIQSLSEEDLIRLINESKSIREILLKIGYKSTGTYLYVSLKNHIENLNIDVPKFKNLNIATNWKKYELSDILVENSEYKSRRGLKYKLVKQGIKEYKCESCGNDGNWNGSPISLQIDHKNGISNDNRVENLCFLCPNCHSQTKTYAGRNIKRIVIENKCKCGVKITKNKKECRSCVLQKSKERNKKNRKVQNRPDIDTIKKSVDDIGYVSTGKLYGVSDNTIRKWIKWSV